MRLKLLYKILNEATTDGHLTLSAEAMYGGQAYKIYGFKMLRQALLNLKEQNLLFIEVSEPVEQLIAANKKDTIVVSNVEYSDLQRLINDINSTLPTVLAVLGNFSPVQDEQILNIKLPEGLDSPQEYSDFNKRISKIFKKFGVDSDDVHIVGFDSGSQWYEVLCQNASWIFPFIISCLQLALEVWKFFKDSKDKPETQFTVNIINNNFTKGDDKITIDNYLEKVIDEKIQKGIEERLSKLGAPGGKTQEESTTMLVQATKELVKELGEGTEFHLSLNPPDYVKEGTMADFFSIDYSSIPKTNKINAPKEAPEIGEGDKQKTDNQQG